MSRKVLIPGVLVVAAAAWFLSHRGLEDTAVSGTIEQDEARIGSRVGGRLVRLYVDEGAAVTNGQVLAELDAAELRARRDLTAARLAELEAGPRTQDIAAARSEWTALVVEAAHAEKEAQRATRLSQSSTLSASETEGVLNRAEILDKKSRAAKDRLDLLQAGTRPEVLDQARAQTREAEVLLAETLVRAPADGTLDALHAREGDVLSPNAPVATIVFQRAPWVRIYVPEPWLPHLQSGQKMQVSVDGYPGKTFAAEIVQIARKAEFTPRNVQTAEERVRQVFAVKLRLPADAGLRPGMTAEVKMEKKAE